MPFITTAHRAFRISRAIYAVGERSAVISSFTRTLAECNLKYTNREDVEITSYVGGFVDRAISSFQGAGDLNLRLGEAKAIEPDHIRVRFLSSGVSRITGVALKLFFKTNFFNCESKQKIIERFQTVLALTVKEMNLRFVEYDDWNQVQERYPQLQPVCDWPPGFLYDASESFRTKTEVELKRFRANR